MAESFDAYHEWLGIGPKDQPPNHYRLLGIDLYEAKANVIDSAADRQMAHLRSFQSGQRSKVCQKLLNEISAARLLLLDQDKKAAYDGQLKKKLAAKRMAAQPRLAQAMPISQPTTATAAPQPVAAAPASTAPQIHGGVSRRRKKKGLGLPLGIGAVVLGLAAVLAVIASTGGEDDDNDDPVAVKSKSPIDKSSNAPPAEDSATTPDEVSDVDETDTPPTAPTGVSPQDGTSPDDKEKVDPSEPGGGDDLPPDDIPPPDTDPPPLTIVSPNKAAVPDEAALSKAEVEIRGVLDLDAAKDIESMAQMAREMLDAALESDDTPVAQFAMLRMIRDASAKHGDYAAAERTIDVMDKRFEIDADGLRIQAMTTALASKTPLDWRKQLSRTALTLVADLHQADRYEQAGTLIAAVLRTASRVKDPPLLISARKLRTEGIKLAEQYEAVRPAFETLKTKPDDPAANTAAGKYVCFIKGDWDRGLAMLAQGTDKPLSALATREKNSTDDVPEQLVVADAWWELAEDRPNPAQFEIRSHAVQTYQMIVQSLSGLEKVKVKQRLAQAATLAKKQPSRRPRRPRHPADAVAFGRHWYKVVVGPISWDAAKKRCEEMGGYLACVETVAEAKAIDGLVAPANRSGKYIYLGGFKDKQGRWQWINGRTVSFSHFRQGAPDNNRGVEDRLATGSTGAWEDVRSDEKSVIGFVCEWDR